VSTPAGRLVLASASPRRRDLLRDAGLIFEVEPADVDETLAPGTEPERGACELARAKARHVAARQGPDAWVIGADTVVAVGSELLGKPASAGEAEAMLRKLSDTRHRVVTGVCVVRCADAHEWTEPETTFVTMRAIQADERAAYVASGEWRDKAGGYAIQETADRFVTALEGGGFDNVVGLPTRRTLALLARAGWGAARPV
jgi:septum formation protein